MGDVNASDLRIVPFSFYLAKSLLCMIAILSDNYTNSESFKGK